MSEGYLKHMLCRDTNYRKAFGLAVLLPLLLLAAAAVVRLSWDELSRFVPPCMLHSVTGLNCIACGATRATFALARGDLLTAVYYNPLYLVFLCGLLYWYCRLILSLVVRPYRPYRLTLTLPQGLAIAAVCLAFAIVRNLSFYRAIFY